MRIRAVIPRNKAVSTADTAAIPIAAVCFTISIEHLWIIGTDNPVTENGIKKEASVASQRNPNMILYLEFRRNTASALTMNNSTFVGTEKEPSQAIACVDASHPDSFRGDVKTMP